MQIEVEGYRFDFPKAIDAFKFDDCDKTSPHFHAGSRFGFKAVDVLVEYDECYCFIEIKGGLPDKRKCDFCGNLLQGKKDLKKWLGKDLIQKYRDSFLYRYCECKLDKPIRYICLLNLEAALLSYFKTELGRMIPDKKHQPARWPKTILDSLIVTNEATWNRNLASKFGTCTLLPTV